MRFPTTRWTLLDQAARGNGDVRHRALADLLRLYVGPIRAFIIARRGVSPDQADDILQDFLSVKWLEQDLLSRAQRDKGRFRSYLLTALDHFISNWYRKRRVDRPGALAIGVAADSEAGGADEPAAPGGRPQDQFDLVWAQQVVQTAIERMRAECNTNGRQDVWAVFEARLLGPILGEAPPPAYAELVQRFGFQTPAQAQNLLVTAKRTFMRTLRAVILEYEGAESDVDAELRDLQEILARPRG
jgi:RNA polymerase sigma-70 factor (ECF subfamily)